MGYKLSKIYVGDHQQVRPDTISYTITGSTQVGSTYNTSYTDIQGCYISPDGTNMYLDFWNDQNLHQYTLSTPRNPNTATEVRYITASKPDCVHFSSDGTKMYMGCETSPVTIDRYTLSTAWDISTATKDQSLTVGGLYPVGISLSDDGTQLYYFWQESWSSTKFISYDLSTPRDLTTVTNQKILTSSNWTYKMGKYLYYGESGILSQYELADPTDITSAQTLVGSYTYTSDMNEFRALWVSSDGKYWSYGINGKNINVYEAQPMS